MFKVFFLLILLYRLVISFKRKERRRASFLINQGVTNPYIETTSITELKERMTTGEKQDNLT